MGGPWFFEKSDKTLLSFKTLKLHCSDMYTPSIKGQQHMQ